MPSITFHLLLIGQSICWLRWQLVVFDRFLLDFSTLSFWTFLLTISLFLSPSVSLCADSPCKANFACQTVSRIQILHADFACRFCVIACTFLHADFARRFCHIYPSTHQSIDPSTHQSMNPPNKSTIQFWSTHKPTNSTTNTHCPIIPTTNTHHLIVPLLTYPLTHPPIDPSTHRLIDPSPTPLPT